MAAADAGEVIDLNQMLTAAEQQVIHAAFERHGRANLTGVHESLGGRFEFGLLRLCRTARLQAG